MRAERRPRPALATSGTVAASWRRPSTPGGGRATPRRSRAPLPPCPARWRRICCPNPRTPRKRA
eukprot:11176015-Lingulodinium_polyedra.AAC.1